MSSINAGVIQHPFFPPRLAYDSDARLQFFGMAEPGTATSAAAFMIAEMSYDSDSNLTSILMADGNYQFDNVWDDRTTLSYS